MRTPASGLDCRWSPDRSNKDRYKSESCIHTRRLPATSAYPSDVNSPPDAAPAPAAVRQQITPPAARQKDSNASLRDANPGPHSPRLDCAHEDQGCCYGCYPHLLQDQTKAEMWTRREPYGARMPARSRRCDCFRRLGDRRGAGQTRPCAAGNRRRPPYACQTPVALKRTILWFAPTIHRVRKTGLRRKTCRWPQTAGPKRQAGNQPTSPANRLRCDNRGLP